MRRDEASPAHDFSTASGVVNLVRPEIPRPPHFIGIDERTLAVSKHDCG